MTDKTNKYKNNDNIISELKKIHGNKYDYSLVNYIDSKRKNQNGFC